MLIFVTDTQIILRNLLGEKAQLTQLFVYFKWNNYFFSVIQIISLTLHDHFFEKCLCANLNESHIHSRRKFFFKVSSKRKKRLMSMIWRSSTACILYSFLPSFLVTVFTSNLEVSFLDSFSDYPTDSQFNINNFLPSCMSIQQPLGYFMLIFLSTHLSLHLYILILF